MFAPLLVALTMAVAGQTTPDAVFRAAYADDIASVPAEKQHVTRYLSVAAYPELVRQQFVPTMTGALNCVSWRGELAKPVVVADRAGHPLLMRIDLESLGWDYGSRLIRLRELERRGVNFGFKDDRERQDWLNPWEKMARDEPYFFVSHKVGKHFVRGWIDPVVADAAWRISKSTKFILRADWLVSRLLTEKDFNGGYYSLLLGLPPTERDLYKVFVVDIDAVDRAENLLRLGGAVLKSSGVAHNNRELQLVPSSYGRPVSYLYRTYDVNVDQRGDKSVLEALAGTLKHNGREIIGSLPNGLFWAYLCDAGNNKSDGKQVAVVPDVIASVQEPLTPSRDTRVANALACFKCHPSAVREFDDVVRKAIYDPTVALAIKANGYQKAEAASLKASLEDYYNSQLGQTIKLHQAMYETRVFEATGMRGIDFAKALVGFAEGYPKDTVGVEQAGRETGYNVEETEGLLRSAIDLKSEQEGYPRPDSIAVVLSTGQEQTRGAWEQTVGNVLRAKIWPWETRVKPVNVTVPADQPAPLYYMPNGYGTPP